MLGALIVVDLLLAVLEMGYVHIRFFKKKLLSLLKLVLPLAVAGVAVCWAEMSLPLPIHSYFAFAVYGVILVVVNGVIGVAVGLLFNRKELLALLKRAKNLIKRK